MLSRFKWWTTGAVFFPNLTMTEISNIVEGLQVDGTKFLFIDKATQLTAMQNIYGFARYVSFTMLHQPYLSNTDV